MQVAENALCRRMEHPLGGIAANDPRHASVGGRRALPDDPSQLVAAFGLYHYVHILPGCKARAKGNGQRSNFTGSAKVFLGENRIHYHVRF